MARILIVDDHATNRDLLKTILGYAGHSCLEAGDGVEALEILESAHPDLVISDILMPTMDGVAFVNCLHADSRWSQIPVLFHTATYRLSEAKLLAQSCGVMRVIPKPCLPQEVLDAVHATLGLPRFNPKGRADEPPRTEVPPWPIALDQFSNHQEVKPDQIQATLTRLESVSMRLVALLKANLDSSEERDPSVLLTRFCRTARELVSARFAVLGIMEDNSTDVCHLITQGLPQGLTDEIPPPSGFLQRLLRDGRPMRVKASGEDPRVWGLPQGTPEFASLLAVPVVSPRRTVGWLYLLDRLGTDMFTEEDESLASALGAQLALAYENLRLVETLKLEIRQRAQSEAARQNLMEIIESSEDAVISADLKLIVTDWNQGAELLLGYQAKEMIGRPARMIVPEEALPEFEAMSRGAIRGTRMPIFESTRVRKDGSLVQVAVFVRPSRDIRGRLTGLTAILRDLTGRRRLESSMEEIATQLQNVFNSIDEVVWSFDTVNQKFLALSPACSKVLGHSPEAFMAEPLLLGKQVDGRDLPAYKAFLDELSEGRPSEVEYRVNLPNKGQHWVRASGKPQVDASGRVIRCDGLTVDITERHWADEALRKSEESFRSLVESVDDLVCTLDPEGHITGLHGRGLAWLGDGASGLLGKDLLGVLPPALVPTYEKRCREVLADGPSRYEETEIAGRVFRISAAPIRGGSGGSHGLVAVVHDLTEFLQLRERLSQQERLAALGSLVGTVAHDVRNPLMAILAGLAMLETEGPLPPASVRAAGLLRMGAEKINALMKELLEYAHPQPLALKGILVSTILQDALRACELLAQERQVELQAEPGEVPLWVRVDPLRVHQVLKNLIENAIQHSPSAGTVAIHGGVDMEGGFEVSIADQGNGIPSADLPKLFDPFFTRRPGGTGLGLAISLRIVEMHGGSLQASNRPEGGAVFRMLLPRSSIHGGT